VAHSCVTVKTEKHLNDNILNLRQKAENHLMHVVKVPHKRFTDPTTVSFQQTLLQLDPLYISFW
jgi:hypothetical protein